MPAAYAAWEIRPENGRLFCAAFLFGGIEHKCYFLSIEKGGIRIATTTKDERILSALLSTPTVKSAAKECGLSANTIYARLRDKDFADRYYSARLELLSGHVATLHGFLGAAINTLGQVMESADATPQTRLNAAEAIIRNCVKLTEETDIIRRLEALENEYK